VFITDITPQWMDSEVARVAVSKHIGLSRWRARRSLSE